MDATREKNVWRKMMDKEPRKYVKKPIPIDALQFLNGDGPSTIQECIDFTGGIATYLDDEDKLLIPTLEGDHRANPGDYIIKGVRGEFYPCKQDIFEETYGEV